MNALRVIHRAMSNYWHELKAYTIALWPGLVIAAAVLYAFVIAFGGDA